MPAVLLLFALASWLGTDFLQTPAKTNTAAVAAYVDYFSHGYQRREMDANGIETKRLQASKITHYTDDSAQLTMPRLTLRDKNTVWTITAQSGQLATGGNDLLLQQRVQIVRAANLSAGAIRIHTEEININIAAKTADSKLHSKIISDNGTIEGIGLVASFAEPGTIRLLSEVRGSYDLH